MEQTLLQLIEKSENYHLATVEANQKPHIRVFGSKAIIDGDFCICMGNKKPVYQQIVKNNNVALSGHIQNYNWWRASANAVEITSEQTKQKMFESMPQLVELYKDREDEFAIFALKNLELEQF